MDDDDLRAAQGIALGLWLVLPFWIVVGMITLAAYAVFGG